MRKSILTSLGYTTRLLILSAALTVPMAVAHAGGGCGGGGGDDDGENGGGKDCPMNFDFAIDDEDDDEDDGDYPGNLGTSYTFTETFGSQSVSLSASGWTFDRDNDVWRAADIVRNGDGLGIDNSSAGPGEDGSHQIDNSGWYDLLAVELPLGMTATSVTFGAVGFNDDWAIWASSDPVTFSSYSNLNTLLSDLTSVGTGNTTESTITLPQLTSWVFFGGLPDGSNDDFRLHEICLEIVSDNGGGAGGDNFSEVPLPGAALLFVPALLGGAAVARRRRTA